jgi:hypothetical protein
VDAAKCRALKRELAAQPEPPLVPIERFFDGNDDLGSIGCNLMPHPGIDAFRDVLTGLLSRSDVTAVYAQIAELDPGAESWPFTDTIAVVGAIGAVELQRVVAPLQPDEVGKAADLGVSPTIGRTHGAPVLGVWWD